MADDALMQKAASALTNWLLNEVCGRCTARPMLSNDCLKRVCVIPGLVRRADAGARAVLEAAEVAGEEPESRDAMVHDMVMQSLLEEHRRKAALQRAGKE